MPYQHPETELIPYLHGELALRDRARVGDHLRECADCTRALGAFGEVVDELRRSIPEPPALHWARYRAELRARLDARAQAGPGTPRWWWTRPLPLALAAGLAGVLAFLALHGGPRRPADDPTVFERTVLPGKLDLLRNYSLLERLDLLEDLDVIRDLDRLAPERKG